MWLRLFALGLLISAAGCQAVQLRNRVVKQASTLSDIQYQQVLDNLAMFSHEPASLPHFSLTPTGLVTIQQTESASGGLNWNYTFFGAAAQFVNHLDKKSLGVTAQQQNIGQWNTHSVLNPDELGLMRCAYQRAVGYGCQECEAQLASFFSHSKARLDAIHPGWFGVGGKKDVPHGACHVGRYCKTYVWVMPEAVDTLTQFTLAILDIATTYPARSLDPLVARLLDMERRLEAQTRVYEKLPDKQSPAAKTLKANMDKLLEQYNSALEEKLKKGGPESDLFFRLRKEFHDFNQSPNVVPRS